MEILKLTSIRLSKDSLAAAAKLGRDFGYNSSSEVLRVAIWLGLKLISPGVLRQLLRMKWEEEMSMKSFTLEDVLRTAGIIDDVKHDAGL